MIEYPTDNDLGIKVKEYANSILKGDYEKSLNLIDEITLETEKVFSKANKYYDTLLIERPLLKNEILLSKEKVGNDFKECLEKLLNSEKILLNLQQSQNLRTNLKTN